MSWLHHRVMGMYAAALVSIIFAAVSLLFAVIARCTSGAYYTKWIALALLGLWTVLPPLYFLWEWWQWKPKKEAEFGKDEDKLSPAEQFAYLKHSHDLSAKFWAAFVLLLAVICGVKFGPQ